MRRIERTSQFKRDYKRESRGRHRASLDGTLVSVIEALAREAALEHRHRDHVLSREWVDHRECQRPFVNVNLNSSPAICMKHTGFLAANSVTNGSSNLTRYRLSNSTSAALNRTGLCPVRGIDHVLEKLLSACGRPCDSGHDRTA